MSILTYYYYTPELFSYLCSGVFQSSQCTPVKREQSQSVNKQANGH